jgi:catechol 2,3-dioxygenase-like lactoylglutathione lyase family enzyme
VARKRDEETAQIVPPAPTTAPPFVLMPGTLGHVKLPVSDVDASRHFYASALAPLGFELVYDDGRAIGFGPPPRELLALEQTAASILGVHVAFDASDPATVDAFHAAALAAGGRDNGAPGLRPYGDNYYAAFVFDPDGHNIEAVQQRH